MTCDMPKASETGILDSDKPGHVLSAASASRSIDFYREDYDISESWLKKTHDDWLFATSPTNLWLKTGGKLVATPYHVRQRTELEIGNLPELERNYVKRYRPTKMGMVKPDKRLVIGSVDSALNAYHCFRSNTDMTSSFIEWEDDFNRKVGPQGHGVHESRLLDVVKSYYDTPRARSWNLNTCLEVRDCLVEYARDLKRKKGSVNYHPFVLDGDKAAGLPFMGHKSDQRVLDAYNQVNDQVDPDVFYPDLIYHRNQRNKIRAVFCASIYNIASMADLLGSVRSFVKGESGYRAWDNPATNLNPALQSHMQSDKYLFVNGDLKKCDMSISWPVVRTVLFEYYQELVGKRRACRLFRSIEKCFVTDFIVGSYVISGEHGAPSGNIFVTDCETSLLLGSQLLAAKRLGMTHSFAEQLGDDLCAAIPAPQASQYKDMLVSVMNELGVEMHSDEKNSVGKFPEFLSRHYELDFPGKDGVIPGAYPMPLLLNSIFNPETAPAAFSDRVGAIFQKLDNLYGHPLWEPMCVYLFENHLFQKFPVDTSSATAADDWWVKLYGVKWNHESSPSAALYNQLIPEARIKAIEARIEYDRLRASIMKELEGYSD